MPYATNNGLRIHYKVLNLRIQNPSWVSKVLRPRMTAAWTTPEHRPIALGCERIHFLRRTLGRGIRLKCADDDLVTDVLPTANLSVYTRRIKKRDLAGLEHQRGHRVFTHRRTTQ